MKILLQGIITKLFLSFSLLSSDKIKILEDTLPHHFKIVYSITNSTRVVLHQPNPDPGTCLITIHPHGPQLGHRPNLRIYQEQTV